MAGVSETAPVAKGVPAAAARMFGWYILAAMVAFLINNILTFWVGLPGTTSLFGHSPSGRAALPSSPSHGAPEWPLGENGGRLPMCGRMSGQA